MPIIFEKITETYEIIVYRFDQRREFYVKGIDFTDQDLYEYESIMSPIKRKQWLASRYWLKKISKQFRTLYLQKSELGKPHISNLNVHFSISHSRDCIAVIYSSDKNVAIDIELIQDKVARVKPKFLHPMDAEQGENLNELTKIWSAKETIYKFYHTRDIYSFKSEIAITKIESDKLHYSLPNYNKQGYIHCQIIENIVITWMEEI